MSLLWHPFLRRFCCCVFQVVRRNLHESLNQIKTRPDTHHDDTTGGGIAVPLSGSLIHLHAAITRAYAPWTQSDYEQTNNRFNAQKTTIGANNLNSLASQWVGKWHEMVETP